MQWSSYHNTPNKPYDINKETDKYLANKPKKTPPNNNNNNNNVKTSLSSSSTSTTIQMKKSSRNSSTTVSSNYGSTYYSARAALQHTDYINSHGNNNRFYYLGVGNSCDESETRLTIVKEIVDSEKYYFNEMEIVIDVFLKPLRQYIIEYMVDEDGILNNDKDGFVNEETVYKIFADLETLLPINKGFLEELEETLLKYNEQQKTLSGRLHGNNVLFGELFQKTGPFFGMYSSYVKNYDQCIKFLELLRMKRPEITSFIRACELQKSCKNLSLESFLIQPIQRIPRYRLLVEQLIKHTPKNHPDFGPLQEANNVIMNVATKINEDLRKQENQMTVMRIAEEFDDLDIVTPSRWYLKDGEMIKLCKKGGRKYHFVLFNDCLIYGAENVTKRGYTLHRKIKLTSGCIIIDDVTGSGSSNNKQILSPSNRHSTETKQLKLSCAFVIITAEKSFVVYTSTLEEKIIWLDQFRKCVSNLNKSIIAEEDSNSNNTSLSSNNNEKRNSLLRLVVNRNKNQKPKELPEIAHVWRLFDSRVHQEEINVLAMVDQIPEDEEGSSKKYAVVHMVREVRLIARSGSHKYEELDTKSSKHNKNTNKNNDNNNKNINNDSDDDDDLTSVSTSGTLTPKSSSGNNEGSKNIPPPVPPHPETLFGKTSPNYNQPDDEQPSSQIYSNNTSDNNNNNNNNNRRKSDLSTSSIDSKGVKKKKKKSITSSVTGRRKSWVFGGKKNNPTENNPIKTIDVNINSDHFNTPTPADNSCGDWTCGVCARKNIASKKECTVCYTKKDYNNKKISKVNDDKVKVTNNNNTTKHAKRLSRSQELLQKRQNFRKASGLKAYKPDKPVQPNQTLKFGEFSYLSPRQKQTST